MLTPDVARLWLDHLNTVLINRRRGAKKAAATRQAKKLAHASVPHIAATTATSEYHCGQCAKNIKKIPRKRNSGLVAMYVTSGTVAVVKICRHLLKLILTFVSSVVSSLLHAYIEFSVYVPDSKFCQTTI